MKYLSAVFALLLVSCATRPAVQGTVPAAGAVKIDSNIFISPPPAELAVFERALWNITTDSPLVKKYLEPGPDSAGTEITVKGECVIDGEQFLVDYDLSGASRDEEAGRPNTYRIEFLMYDSAGGISRTGEVLWTPPEDNTGLLLSFDDAYLMNWHRHFDLFDSYGAKVTFFVQGGLAADSNAVGGYALEYAGGLKNFCREALRRGHGLGFHTISHYDLTRVSRATFNRETVDAAEAFLEAGIPFSAFAFPFGLSDLWMRKALSPAFPLTRGYGANVRFYTGETLADAYFISKAIDNILYPDDAEFERHIRLILLAAKFAGNAIVPLTTHDITDAAQWGIKPQRLEFLLKTARDLRVQFITYSALRP
jgi:peptidoglycan/xylan/chitin deacetylase (PgdA/CDA1 family)